MREIEVLVEQYGPAAVMQALLDEATALYGACDSLAIARMIEATDNVPVSGLAALGAAICRFALCGGRIVCIDKKDDPTP